MLYLMKILNQEKDGVILTALDYLHKPKVAHYGFAPRGLMDCLKY